MAIYKINYTFLTRNPAPYMLGWSDMAMEADSPEEALDKFSKLATRYVKENLISLQLLILPNHRSQQTQWFIVDNVAGLLFKFIEDNAKP